MTPFGCNGFTHGFVILTSDSYGRLFENFSSIFWVNTVKDRVFKIWLHTFFFKR